MTAISRIFRYPYALVKKWRGERSRWRFLSESTKYDAGTISKLFVHLQQSEFERRLHLRMQQIDNTTVGLRGVSSPADARFLYLLVRAAKPAVVVETGVCNGMSSAYILQAMSENEYGRLYSIDLPNSPTVGNNQILPDGFRTGELIPENLRASWELIEGDAKECLLPLLSRLGAIDVFIHDSLHTYEHMLWEYETAWPFIRIGGFLISDDVNWNSAFGDFLKRFNRIRYFVSQGQAALQKVG